MELLVAELLVANGRVEKGLERLAVLAVEDSDVGYRAAWLLALIRLDQGNIEAAKTVLSRQVRLKNSVLGQEMLAKIALSEGRNEDARRIYAAVEKSSIEAKAYFAGRAYADNSLKVARKLSEELLLRFPDRMQLRSNLATITKAQRQP